MDARVTELLKDRLDVKNFELSSKIEISLKGRTFYFKRRKNVHSGTRQ